MKAKKRQQTLRLVNSLKALGFEVDYELDFGGDAWLSLYTEWDKETCTRAMIQLSIDHKDIPPEIQVWKQEKVHELANDEQVF